MKKKDINEKQKLEVFLPEEKGSSKHPIYSTPIWAGFPSPADDYTELKLDLNKFLIKHPSATFYVKVKGDSMKGAGINDGDILVVDRAIEPKNNDIAVCVINSEFTVKRLKKTKDALFLAPENNEYKPIKVTEFNDFQVWGIVAYIIHKT